MKRLTFKNARERIDARLTAAICDATGPCFVLMPSIADVAGNLRQQIGADRRVVRLIWKELDDTGDSFNPLDVAQVVTNQGDAVTLMLGSLFSRVSPIVDMEGSRMPLGETWHRLATAFLPAVVRSNLLGTAKPSLIEALDPLFADDKVYKLATMLDAKGKTLDPNDYSTISSFLQLTEEHRDILLTALAPNIDWINNSKVQRLTEATSFDLTEFGDGSPIILVELPQAADRERAVLARLWLSAFVALVASRHHDRDPALLIADGTCDPGLLPQLLAAQRMPAGRIDVWTMWENLDQLRVPYPADWGSFVDSCDTIEAAGTQGPIGSSTLAEMFGASREALAGLSSDEALQLAGEHLPSQEHLEQDEGRAPAMRPVGHMALFAGGVSAKWDVIAAEIASRANCPVIVFETNGECWRRAGPRRPGLVVRLDPYGLTGANADGFNPWDAYATADLPFSNAQQLTEALVAAGHGSCDSFWRQSSISLMRAVLQYLSVTPGKHASLDSVWGVLASDDVVYNLAVVLDTIGGKLPVWCYHDIAGFLQLADNTRSRVLAETHKDLLPFMTRELCTASSRTTFDIESLLNEPVTIFVELGHAADGPGIILSRLWMAAITKLIAGRGANEHPILFVADAVNDPGMLPYLQTLQRLPTGTVDVWGLWDTIDPSRAAHPADWTSYIDSVAGIAAIGPQSPIGARGLASQFEIELEALLNIAPGDILPVAGVAPSSLGSSRPEREPATHSGHTAIFAPSASDPWSCVESTILARSAQPLVVIEAAGEYFRRTMSNRSGHIVRLDPYQVMGPGGESFNPLHVRKSGSSRIEQATNRLIKTLLPIDHALEPYWRAEGIKLLDALIQCLAVRQEPTLRELRRLLVANEVSEITEILENAGKDSRTISSSMILGHILEKKEFERYSLFSVASSGLYDFCDPDIESAISSSSFDPEQIFSQSGSTIYIEIPPTVNETGRRLARLWIEALLPFMRESNSKPLLVVDNQISEYLLPTLIAHRHDRAIDVLATWDTPGQISPSGQNGWDTYLPSLGRADVVGPLNRHAALQIAEKFGCKIEALESLGDGDLLHLW